LELMDKYGVEMQVLSLTSPGPQGTLFPPKQRLIQVCLIQQKQPNWPPAQMTFS